MLKVHPGEILLEEFLLPLGISAYALATAIRVPSPRIVNILHEREPVDAEIALRLSKFFGTTAMMWLNLQNNYDLAVAQERFARSLEKILPLPSEDS